jgi:hypothetical protein
MLMKPVVLVAAGVAAAVLLSAPVFAAKTPLSDEAMAEVSGHANDYTFNGNSNTTVSLAGGAGANVQFVGYQWSDNHASDQSQDKGANNQSGSASQVQQHVGGQANALFVGSVNQNVLINSEGSTSGNQNVTAYAVVAHGGF